MKARLYDYGDDPLSGPGDVKYRYSVQFRNNDDSPWYNAMVTNEYETADEFLKNKFKEIQKNEDDAIIPLLDSNFNIIDVETDTNGLISDYFNKQRAMSDNFKLLGVFNGIDEIMVLYKYRIYPEYANGQYMIAHWNYGSSTPGRIEADLTADRVFNRLGIGPDQLDEESEAQKEKDEEAIAAAEEEEREEQEQIEENEQSSIIPRHRAR